MDNSLHMKITVRKNEKEFIGFRTKNAKKLSKSTVI